VGQYLEGRFPEQYAEARAPFLHDLAEAEGRIQAWEAEGTRAEG
jgi:hypothetical protein